ncbi:transcription factor E2F8-like [Athalia rosae]|uniref:transcription factor E2F8-like n=1 Tax=Athalia rosae TaxID=37344 RepID=UPI0020341A85|nr:transcription factor E2F8-like [Athalia rosae]
MDPGAKESVDRRVLRELSNVKTEPVSPTANLRLLTTLASNLKSAPQINAQAKISRINISCNSDSDPFKLLPRKEKSLGLLCNKFLSLYPLSIQSEIPQEISLDKTAKTLGTEKRRIYDIINVLESLEMASKAGKNRYLWHGQSNLPSTLARLKSLAITLGLREQIQEIQQQNNAYTADYFDGSPYFIAPVAQSPNIDASFTDINNAKEDKSLGVMCQKFIMLFLVSLKNGVINLDIAAKVLIMGTDEPKKLPNTTVRSRFKTKVRRLYDIANVLTAIGLIKKVSRSDSTIRKPIFKYTGPDIDYIDFGTDTIIREGTRHSLIGMATPIGNGTTKFFPQSTLKQSITPNKLLLGSTTPNNHRREPRKRKLFGTDEKFGRTMSSPCLDTDRPLDRLDDSILQVAEMELERLKSSEQPKPKVCIKLFPRHNSESCVSATQVSGEWSNILNSPHSLESRNIENLYSKPLNALLDKSSPNIPKCQTGTSIDRKTIMAVDNKNLVENTAFNASNSCFPLSNSPLPISVPSLKTQVPTVNVTSVKSDVRMKNEASFTPLKLKIRDPNIMKVENTMSRKLIAKDVGLNATRMVKIAPYKIQAKSFTPKFVNLATFSTNKLIPIKSSEYKITSPLLQPIVVENPSRVNSTSYAILTQVQTPVLSPGDLFKAVQIGDTLQLVPISNQNTIKFTSEINNQSNTNCS